MDIQKLIAIVKETDSIFFDESLKKDVTQKGVSDYVTGVDKGISDYLCQRLKEEFPDVGFISEEEEYEFSADKSYWILDPVDGTTNFMHQLKLSAVSLGYYEGGEIKAGVIYNPDSKELFWAEKGKGAYLNGERIYCSTHSKLEDCLGILEFNPYFKEDSKAALEHASKIYSACQDIRTFGSAAVELSYIACGRCDVFLGRYLKPWDFAAGAVIIKEAGGILSDLDGEIHIDKLNQHIVASNSLVYHDFVNLIK